MEDRRELIEQKYGFQVKNQYRARGAILFDTKDGPLLLREKMKLTGHFEWENEVKEHLRENGMTLLDFAVKNADGEYLTEAEDGAKYVLYRWFSGEECDCKNLTMIRLMAENLGRLHSSLQNFYEEPVLLQQPLLSQYDKHNRELVKVRNYIRSKKKKNDFEVLFYGQYERFMEKARQVAQELSAMGQGGQSAGFCHGDYNQHNILFSKNGIGIVHFECFSYQIQVSDLANYMRKMLEKNNWNTGLGMDLICAYDRVRRLTAVELNYLYLYMAYPEKFWKIANRYYNTHKAWVSGRNIEKLEKFIRQEDERERFLEMMRHFTLQPPAS